MPAGCVVFVSTVTLFSVVVVATAGPSEATNRPPPSLNYVWAKAYHVPPETTTSESGYFSLCEGKNGKIYIGTAGYGLNSYLVEFDPETEKMRAVLDTHSVVGLPAEPTGYAAQAKIHTRNCVGPSGVIYFGSMQGYRTDEEKKTGEPIYKGGYVMTYDPETGEAKNLGMPFPHRDYREAPLALEGQGVIDVVADEVRGLIYVVTNPEHHWMKYEIEHPDKGYRHLGPVLINTQPNTLIDREGRATAMTRDFQIARYDPQADSTTVTEFLVDGKPFRDVVGLKWISPDWRLADDGRTAYLQLLNDLRMFEVDLGGATGKPVHGRSLGARVEGKNPDSRGSISIAPDGRVYSFVRIDNETGFGIGLLHHLVQYDPQRKKMSDMGVVTVTNPDYFDFDGEQGKQRASWGFHRLPDGTLTPLHNILALIAARDGTLYATVLYPFTLLRISPQEISEKLGAND